MSILYFRNSDGKFVQIPFIPGKSAYEIAVEKGVFSGTEEEFAKAQIFENKEILDQITQENIDLWNEGGNIDLTDYATKDYVDEAITDVDVTEQLKDYATKEYVDEAIDDVDVTEQLKDYAKTSDIPTKISQLTNDSNYLTSVPSEYVTDEELNDKGYATQSYVDDIDKTHVGTDKPTNTNATIWFNTDDTNEEIDIVTMDELTNYATKSYVTSEIAKAKLEGEEVDLSGFATKDDLPTKTSQLTNDSGYLTRVPSEYITETELNQAIESVDVTDQLKDYAKKTDVAKEIADLVDSAPESMNTLKELADAIEEHQDVYDAYVDEVSKQLNNKSDKTHTHDQYLTEHQSLSDYAKKTDVPTKTSQLTNDSNYLTSVPSEYIDETDLQIHTDQVLSAGEQLVLNGSQVLQNNYNFSQLTYDGTVANNSAGSLLGGVGKRQDIISDYFFTINPNKPIYVSLDIKGAVGSRFYAFVDFYDVDKNRISANTTMYQPNTLTKLTQDLKKGDTVVHFEDLTNWRDDLTTTSAKSFIFWNWTNSKGYTYPPETYSRNAFTNLYADSSSVDKVNKTITLSTAWNKGTIPAGTYVSQGNNGNNYRYMKGSSLVVGTEWKTIDYVYEGLDDTGQNIQSKFPPATAFAKVGMFLNYNGVADEKVWVTNITVKEDIYSTQHTHDNKTVIDGITSNNITLWGRAYNHSTSTHAPSDAQKNSDITKAEIEAKLTGNITTHTHDYLTSIPSEYVTESELNAKGYATQSYVDNNDIITTFVGTSESLATDSEKIITVDDPKFALRVGTLISIKFSASNTASNVTLNVNGTGAYPIWYSTAEYTSSSTTVIGSAGLYITYMFNGTHWVWVSRGNYPSTSPASLGFGYGVCSTAEETVAKAVTISSYTLNTGGIVVIKFTNAVPKNATLNIRTRGAKKIFYNGSAITDGVINAGDVVTLIYDGTQYQVINICRDYATKEDLEYRDRIHASMIPSGTNIPENADLNTIEYLSVGSYYCSSTARAKTLVNCPVKVAFLMEVLSPLSPTIDNETTKGWVYRLRRLTHYSTGEQYIQFVSSGTNAGEFTYGEWKKTAMLSDVPTKVSELTNDSKYVTKSQLDDAVGDIDFSDFAMKNEIPTKTSDLENDSNFVDEEFMRIEITKALQNDAEAGFIETTFQDETVFKEREEVIVPYTFTTQNHGDAKLYVTLTKGEQQTEYEFSIKRVGAGTFNLGVLQKGVYTVSFFVIDALAKMTNVVSKTVIVGALEISSTFDDQQDFNDYSNIAIPITVSSLDSSKMTATITIDGVAHTMEVYNGYNSYTYPNKYKTIGVHKVSIQVTGGKYASNILEYNVVIISANNLLLSTSQDTYELEYGYDFSMQYRISAINMSEFISKTYINEVLYKTNETNLGSNILTIPYDAFIEDEEYSFRIEVHDVNETVSANLLFKVTVVEGTFERITHNRIGLQAMFRMNTKSNDDEDKDIIYSEVLQDNGKRAYIQLHDYDYSTNGWINGTLRSTGNAWAEMCDYLPLEDNVPNGFSLEILFKSYNIGNDDGRVIDMTDSNSPNAGIYIDSEKSNVKTDSNEMNNYFSDRTRTKLTFVVNRTSTYLEEFIIDDNGHSVPNPNPTRKPNPMLQVYIDGVMTEVVMLSDNGTGNNKILESILCENQLLINTDRTHTHFGVSEIESILIYNRPLDHEDILRNYIADHNNLMEQKAIYESNYVTVDNEIPSIYLTDSAIGSCDMMTKDVKQYVNIVYNSPNPDRFGESFNTICRCAWQGTSSLAYPTKNYKFTLYDYTDINDTDTFKKKKVNMYPSEATGHAEHTYCLKADYMNSNHAHNTGTARLVTDIVFDGCPNPAKVKDPKTRNSINGFPCQLYINGEWKGVFNFNHDKSCSKSLGMETIEDTVRWEIKANSDTSTGAFCKTWKDGDIEDCYTEILKDFEIVYDEDAFNDNTGTYDLTEFYDELGFAYTGEAVYGGYKDFAILILARAIQFVDGCEDEQEWKEHIGKYINIPQASRYYLHTMTSMLIDNFAKNCILVFYGQDSPGYFSFYDLDSGYGLNNTGYMVNECDIEPSHPGVYNCATSKIWTKLFNYSNDDLYNEFKAMREGKYTYENFCKYLVEEQIDRIPIILYNRDMYQKYISQGRTYLHMLHGNGKAYLTKLLYDRFQYVDSLFLQHSSPYTRQSITIRSCMPTGYTIDQYIPKFSIETYCPQYVTVCWRNGLYETKKVGKGETVEFSNQMVNEQDNEIIVYCATNIKRLGDCSDKNPTSIDLANATRLVEFKCENSNKLVKADLSTNAYLKSVSFKNCSLLGTATGGANILDVSRCEHIRNIDTRGTQITQVLTNPNGSTLEEILLSDKTQVISMVKQTYLKVLGVAREINCIPISDVGGVVGNSVMNATTGELTSTSYTHILTDYIEYNEPLILNINKKYTNKPSTYLHIYAYDGSKNYLGRTTIYNASATFPGNEIDLFVSTFANTKYIRIQIERINSGVALEDFEVGGIYQYTQNLSTVNIVDCNALRHISYPYTENATPDFSTLRYVQNLTINNSLPTLTTLSFEGYDRLRNVRLENLPNLTHFSFNDMLGTSTEPTLESVILTGLPITVLSMNTTSSNYKIAFNNATLDLSGLLSLSRIESNYGITGLDTIILPLTCKELSFSATNTIKNLISSTSSHLGKNDDFEGIDFKDMIIEEIDMSKLGIMYAENFNIAPRTINPQLNYGKNSNFFRPINGTFDISNWSGTNLMEFFRGLNLANDKFEIVCNKQLTKVIDITDIFRCCNFNTNSYTKINNLLSKLPNVTKIYNAFRETNITTARNLVLPSKVDDVRLMFYKCTQLTHDLVLPSNTTKADQCFYGCTNLTNITSNWDNCNPTTTSQCYALCNKIQYIDDVPSSLDYVPKAWGGNGYEVLEITETVGNTSVNYAEYDTSTITLGSEFSQTGESIALSGSYANVLADVYMEGHSAMNVYSGENNVPITYGYGDKTGNSATLSSSIANETFNIETIHGDTLVNLAPKVVRSGRNYTNVTPPHTNASFDGVTHQGGQNINNTTNGVAVTGRDETSVLCIYDYRYIGLMHGGKTYTIVLNFDSIIVSPSTGASCTNFTVKFSNDTRYQAENLSVGRSVHVVTVPSGTNITEWRIGYANNNFNFVGQSLAFSHVMMLEGDWSNKEIPPYFEGVKSSFELEKNSSNKYECKVMTYGKNLAKSVSVKTGYIDMEFICEGVGTYAIQLTPNIDLSGNTLYWTDDISTRTNRISLCYVTTRSGVTQQTFSINEEKYEQIKSAKKSYLYIYKSGASFTTAGNVQVEKSSSVTTYEPFNDNSKTLLLNAPLYANDYINYSASNEQPRVMRYAKTLTLTGGSDETWSAHSAGTNDEYISFILQKKTNYGNAPWKAPNGVNEQNVYCDKFVGLRWEEDNTNNNLRECVWSAISSCGIIIEKAKLQSVDWNSGSANTLDVAGFRRFLAKNPVTILYETSGVTYEYLGASGDGPIYIKTDVAKAKICFDSKIPIKKFNLQKPLHLQEQMLCKDSTTYRVTFDADHAGKITTIQLGNNTKTNINVTKGRNTFTMATTTPHGTLGYYLNIEGRGFSVSNLMITETDKTYPNYFQGLKSVGEGNNLIVTSKGSSSNSKTLPVILRGIGSVKDKVVKVDGKWYVERYVHEYSLTGSEVWSNETKDSWFSAILYFTNNTSLPTPKANGGIICNQFVTSTSNTQRRIGVGSSSIKIIFPTSECSSTSAFKTWLQSNPTKIIYQLAQPILEPLSVDSELTLYNTSTTITNNSTIPCNMTIKNKGWSVVLAPSKTYRILRSGGTPTKYYLGGATSTSNVITTPATLVDNDLRIYGSGTTKNVMVIDNTQPTLNPIYHEGILSTFEGDYNSTTKKYEYKIAVTGTDGEENSKIISLNEPLRYLSSTVRDRIIVKDGELVVERNCAEVTFTGTESWSIGDEAGNTVRFRLHLTNKKVANIPIICDKFSRNTNITDDREYIFSDNYNNMIQISILKARLNALTVEEFKAWLKANPLRVIYQKDVATYETLGLPRLSMVAYENGTVNVVTDLQPSSITTERTLDISKLTDAQVLNLEERLSNVETIQDITMMALDEMYNMLEPVLDMMPTTVSVMSSRSKTVIQEEVRVPMVELYVVMVQRGLKTIDQVPERYREQVRKILDMVE